MYLLFKDEGKCREKSVVVEELVQKTMQTSWHEPTWRNTGVPNESFFEIIYYLFCDYLFAMSLSDLKSTARVCLSTFSIIPLLIKEHTVTNTSGTSFDRTANPGSDEHRLWSTDNGYPINTKAAAPGDNKFSNFMFKEAQHLSPHPRLCGMKS